MARVRLPAPLRARQLLRSVVPLLPPAAYEPLPVARSVPFVLQLPLRVKPVGRRERAPLLPTEPPVHHRAARLRRQVEQALLRRARRRMVQLARAEATAMSSGSEMPFTLLAIR